MDATPEKRVLPASGDTDNRHRLPTHAAGGPQVSLGASLPGGVAIRGAYPNPPVDAGHRVCGGRAAVWGDTTPILFVESAILLD